MAPPQAQRDVERSEQRDQHSKSPAVHQDKVWSVIPWYEFSEENLTMARCGALRREVRLGQVAASWDSLIFFNVPSVRARACTVALWCEFGWLLLHGNSRIVQLPSVLHVGVSLLFSFSTIRVWAVIDFWSSDVVPPLKSFTKSLNLVGMPLRCDGRPSS